MNRNTKVGQREPEYISQRVGPKGIAIVRNPRFVPTPRWFLGSRRGPEKYVVVKPTKRTKVVRRDGLDCYIPMDDPPWLDCLLIYLGIKRWCFNFTCPNTFFAFRQYHRSGSIYHCSRECYRADEAMSI